MGTLLDQPFTLDQPTQGNLPSVGCHEAVQTGVGRSQAIDADIVPNGDGASCTPTRRLPSAQSGLAEVMETNMLVDCPLFVLFGKRTQR